MNDYLLDSQYREGLSEPKIMEEKENLAILKSL